MTTTAQAPLSSKANTVGLKTAMNILDKWGCSPEQEWQILGMKKSSYYKNRENPDSARISNDQLERISYILNMHQSLRVVFDNPENVYGFMGMKNHNPFFNGRSPLELLSSGRFGTLYEVFKRVDALRGGGL